MAAASRFSNPSKPGCATGHRHRSFIHVGLVLALAAVSVPAQAADVATTSKIETVTVYPSGAEILRTAEVELPAGQSTLVFRNLPIDIRPETIRVEAIATAALEIGPVETEQQRLTRDETAAAAAERKALEDRLEDARKTLEKIGYDIKAKETQRTFLENLAGLPARPPAGPAQGAAAPTDWGALFAMLGTNMATVQTELFDLNQKYAEQEEVIADLESELARLASGPTRAIAGRVSVQSAAAGTATVKLRYAVRDASWSPLYEARLTTGAKPDDQTLRLIRRAAIRQSTSEVWKDVRLVLSTVRPGGRTSAPTVRPVSIDFLPPQEPKKRTGMFQLEATEDEARPVPSTTARRLRSRAATGLAAAAPAEAVRATEAAANVQLGSFQATYEIAETTTVLNNGAVKQLKIDEQTLKPELKVVTAPRTDPRAYLYARFELPEGSPYLAGLVSLFRDGTYVGRGRLPELPGGENHDLGFGADDLVRVRFARLDEKRGESGIISSSKTDERRFRIELTNNHAQPIAYEVHDRMPIARDEAIAVERTGTRPSRTDIENRQGVVAWDGKLDAKAKRAIDFGYQISWPADRKIRFR